MQFSNSGGTTAPGGPRGAEIFGHPLLNKDAAFTARERDELGLRGLLPWRVAGSSAGGGLAGRVLTINRPTLPG